MVRRRGLQILRVDSLDLAPMRIVHGHFQRLKLFKPKISVVVPAEWNIYTDEESILWRKEVLVTQRDKTLDLFVIRDGRKAYLKRVWLCDDLLFCRNINKFTVLSFFDA